MIDRRGFLTSTTLAGAALTAPPSVFAAQPTTLLSPDIPMPLGDLPFPAVRGNDETYSATKTGNAQGAAGNAYDDTG